MLKLYLEQLSEEANCFFVIEILMLLLPTILVGIHSAFSRSAVWLWPLLVLSAVSLAMQVVEISRNWCRHLKEWWRFVDFLRFVFTLALLAVYQSRVSEEDKASVLSLTTLFHGVRAFSIFFFFQCTRVLLRTVLEILKRMGPFVVFVFASLCFLALLLSAATPESAL